MAVTKTTKQGDTPQLKPKSEKTAATTIKHIKQTPKKAINYLDKTPITKELRLENDRTKNAEELIELCSLLRT